MERIARAINLLPVWIYLFGESFSAFTALIDISLETVREFMGLAVSFLYLSIRESDARTIIEVSAYI